MQNADTFAQMKRELRREIRAKQENVPLAELERIDADICTHFLAMPELETAERVYAYASYGREVSTLAVLRGLRKLNKYVYICWDWPPDKLAAGRDVIIVPAVAFDREGYRLGQGGGYYDRLLSACANVFSVGLARNFLLQTHVPREPHDMRVNALVTESGVRRLTEAER